MGNPGCSSRPETSRLWPERSTISSPDPIAAPRWDRRAARGCSIWSERKRQPGGTRPFTATCWRAPRMRRKPVWIAVQVVFVAAAVWFAGRALSQQWTAVRDRLATVRPSWGLIVLSCVPVLIAYAVLIQVWRAMLSAWGEGGRLSPGQAARIWFISNLGRYVPGKVWQIATMGLMAQQRGVSPVAAAGSSLVVNLANIASGFVVVLATGAAVFSSFSDSGPRAGILTAILLGGGLLLLPLAFSWGRPLVSRITRQRITLPELPARAVWL